MQYRVQGLNQHRDWVHILTYKFKNAQVFNDKNRAQALAVKLEATPEVAAKEHPGNVFTDFLVDGLDVEGEAERTLLEKFSRGDPSFPLIIESGERWAVVELMHPQVADARTISLTDLDLAVRKSKTLDNFWDILSVTSGRRMAANPCQVPITERARNLATILAAKKKPAADAPAVLYKYTDEDGNVFYLDVRKPGAKSPFTGKAVKAKPEKFTPGQIPKELKKKG